ncbi:hypothetical protein [Roseiflexus sp.]
MDIPPSVPSHHGESRLSGIVYRIVLISVLVAAMGSVVVAGQSADPQQSAFRVYLPLIVTSATPLTNLSAITATYLGAASADELNGAAFASDGTLITAGALPGYAPPGADLIVQPGATNGAVVRLSADGSSVLSVLRIGGIVRDLDTNASGALVVCGDMGVARLNASATAVIWSAAPGNATRCSIGADGVVAALAGASVFIYDGNGALIGSWTVTGTTAGDLVVDSSRTQVIVGGYTQVNSTLQLPWIRAYAYDGGVRWRSYDVSAAPGLGADSRVERLAFGADGKLYVAGSINGGIGASIFSRDPKDVTLPLGARLVKSDEYSDSTNTGSVKIAWFGRFNPEDGALELAQGLLTRRTSDNKGNSVSIRAIAADERGRVFLAGDAACCIKNRDQQRIAGVAVGPYESGEGYIALVSEDFRQRLVWTPYAGPTISGGSSAANALTVRNGNVLTVAKLNLDKPRSLITVNAIQPTPSGSTGSEGYLLLWRAP